MLETYEVKEDGEIKISDHVIAVIATVAALSIDGVSKMSGTLAEDLQTKLKLRSNDDKGVKVSFNEDHVDISMYIYVEYGYALVDVATAVQKAVFESIKSMTDMEIGCIDITIEGVTVDNDLKSIPAVNR